MNAGWRCLPDLKSLLNQTPTPVFITSTTTGTTLPVAIPYQRSTVAQTPGSTDNSVWLSS